MNVKKGIVLAGLGLLAFGVVTFGASFVLPIKTSTEWYGKVGSLAGSGVLLTTLGVYLDELKGLFVKKPSLVFPKTETENVNLPVEVKVTMKNETELDLEESMEMDYKCLNYLANRFKGMKNKENRDAGLVQMSLANGLLFKEYHLEENTSSVDAVPAAV